MTNKLQARVSTIYKWPASRKLRSLHSLIGAIAQMTARKQTEYDVSSVSSAWLFIHHHPSKKIMFILINIGASFAHKTKRFVVWKKDVTLVHEWGCFIVFIHFKWKYSVPMEELYKKQPTNSSRSKIVLNKRIYRVSRWIS